MSNRRDAHNRSKRLALTALLTGLSLLFLYGASLLPGGRLGLTAVAGLFPAAAVASFGLSAGFLCYAGTAILALLLVTDKGLALLYLLFFGLYPMVKGAVEQLRRPWLEILLKLAFYLSALTVLLLGFRAVLLAVLPWENTPFWLLYLGGGLVFLAYDFGFSKVICLYEKRLGRVLRNR